MAEFFCKRRRVIDHFLQLCVIMKGQSMKKSYKHDVLSETKRCVKCGKRLKKRIEIEHPNFIKCYRCYKGLPVKEDQE